MFITEFDLGEQQPKETPCFRTVISEHCEEVVSDLDAIIDIDKELEQLNKLMEP